jgi:hypothetical protein
MDAPRESNPECSNDVDRRNDWVWPQRARAARVERCASAAEGADPDQICIPARQGERTRGPRTQREVGTTKQQDNENQS